MEKTRTMISVTPKKIGEEVVLFGWAATIREHGKNLSFVELRDSSGTVQVVVTFPIQFSREYVLEVTGMVQKRDEKLVNDKQPTGGIEIVASSIKVINKSEALPFEIESDGRDLDENIRLKYRFLDLRRPRLQKIMRLRHDYLLAVRNWFDSQNFLEVITPLLTTTSPEGARDFIIPSRVHKGKFYVLPQAPQQFKQLLMVGGVNRYFQIAPCARDEDPRADRHYGVFYQIDVEVSFPTRDIIFDVCERLIKETYPVVAPHKKIQTFPFPRISYEESVNTYGTDKPDLRFDLKLIDVTQELKNKTEFAIFNNASCIKTICIPNASEWTRKQIETYEEFAKSKGAKGLAHLKLDTETEVSGGVAKYINPQLLETIKAKTHATSGSLLFFSSDTRENVHKVLGAVRNKLGDDLGLKDPNLLSFAWITDFPFYEINDEGKLDFGHNPFSMPVGGKEAFSNPDPLKIVSNQYDLALNGYEILSGSIRNHDPEALVEAFERVGYGREEILKRFGGIYNAFHYGAPPHGGFAIGVDRYFMVLVDEPNIRDVYAFPLNSNGVDVMMNAPSVVSDKQLTEAGIRLSPEAQDILNQDNEGL